MHTEKNELALTILQTLEIAVLSRTGPRQYAFYGHVPEFYAELFPSDAEGPCTRPWEHSSMLEYFLDDAELFFIRNLPGSINSGVWQEDGTCDGEQALHAQAVIVGEEHFLIIRLLKEDFRERLRVLRKAREQLLERNTLNRDLETYQRKSSFDGLTQVLNKATFIERLGKEMEIAQENSASLSVAMIDIDFFKRVNDEYGHLCGDAVLASLGQLLRQTLRRQDIVARFGGEEFAVVTPFTTLGQCVRTVEKLRRAIEEHDFSPVPKVTVSIGCTGYILGETWESFLQRADIALYDAKNNGRNMVKIR
ncbi:MAG: GGDEF domain-containing protein [Desulfovibrionaceae bacterium]|nr:GGDEF domain-containing protein [Desulfovibrionaceae bacterium]